MTTSKPQNSPPRPAARRRGRASAGALLMLFPLLTLAIGIAWLQGRKPSPGAPPQVPGAISSRSVPTWEGEIELASGGVLKAHLSRLHSDPRRQEFDARALRERLGFDAGEPWRLQLRLTGGAERPLPLGQVLVQDAQGACLATLPGGGGAGLADPLAVLFRAPEELGSNEVASLLLWGLEPREGAELRGIAAGIGLTQRTVEVSGQGAAIARLRRRLEVAPASAGIPAERLIQEAPDAPEAGDDD